MSNLASEMSSSIVFITEGPVEGEKKEEEKREEEKKEEVNMEEEIKEGSMGWDMNEHIKEAMSWRQNPARSEKKDKKWEIKKEFRLEKNRPKASSFRLPDSKVFPWKAKNEDLVRERLGLDDKGAFKVCPQTYPFLTKGPCSILPLADSSPQPLPISRLAPMPNPTIPKPIVH